VEYWTGFGELVPYAAVAFGVDLGAALGVVLTPFDLGVPYLSAGAGARGWVLLGVLGVRGVLVPYVACGADLGVDFGVLGVAFFGAAAGLLV
jgi:hypothetical protein